MALLTYYPEMKEAKPAASYEARMSHNGRHYFVKTPKTIQGRGVEFLGTLTADTLAPFAHNKIGWNEYKLTQRAFAALTKAQDVSAEILL